MVKYYKNIEELPIYNFNKVLETGDLKWIVASGDITHTANVVWDTIIDEYSEYVGFSQSYIDYMAFSKKAALLTIQAYLEDKRHLITFAKVAQQQADAALGETENDFEKSVAIVSKYMGYRVDAKKTSVKEFYSIIKLMKDGKQENTK